VWLFREAEPWSNDVRTIVHFADVPKIPRNEFPTPVQAMEKMTINRIQNTIDMKMDNMMKAVEASTFQMSKAEVP